MKRIRFVAIMSLSLFLFLSFCSISYAEEDINIIGIWYDAAYKNGKIHIISIEGDSFLFFTTTDKENIFDIEILEKNNNKYFRKLHAQKDKGEYYVINYNKELEIYNANGMMRKCQPYSGPKFPFFHMQIPSTAITRKLDILPTVAGDFLVQVDILTDLPDGSLIGVNLSKHGLANDDLFVGTDLEKVSVNDGKASILIDAQKNPRPSLAAIVKGEYDVEVMFSPRWKENKEIAQSAGIKNTIEVVKVVSLNGTSKGAEDYSKQKLKAENRKWVMENVNQGMQWDAKYWEGKYGKPEKYKPDSGNNNVLKMFYFKEIDLTLQVNTQKNEIVTWIDGKAR